jgi:hypothetical protein
MKKKHILKKILVEACSVKFWIAVMVIAILCFCANVEGEAAASDTIVYHLLLHASRQDCIAKGELYSAYGVIMAFRNNFWFPIVVPIVAAIPYIYHFSTEWLSGYYYIRLHRSKRISYALESVLMAAFTGFLVMCIGILLYGLACLFLFPSYGSYGLQPGESILAELYGQTPMARLFSFLKVLLHMGLLGSISSVFSLILLTVVRDCFLSLTFPMMLVYLSSNVCNYYLLFIREQYADNPPALVNTISLLIPYMYTSMENQFHQWFGISNVLWYFYLLAILGVLTMVMIHIVKRRDV